ncbi:MAG: ubiquinol-cytochrome c chaperone [Hyphomicrobiales bacterium]|nr:ubiquinol-cytochrome c chaperone [Hyphomicrobiales bacterium]
MFGLFKRNPNRVLIDKLHGEIMAGVQQPALYLDCGVPDTFEGRLEMLILHTAATVRRIEQLAAPGPELAQDVMDGVFRHLDGTLREMGVGDITVPKRIKKHAEAFAGRTLSYARALEENGEAALRVALARNVLRDETRADAPETHRLAAYVRAVEARLATYDLNHFLAGTIGFPAPKTGAA